MWCSLKCERVSGSYGFSLNSHSRLELSLGIYHAAWVDSGSSGSCYIKPRFHGVFPTVNLCMRMFFNFCPYWEGLPM